MKVTSPTLPRRQGGGKGGGKGGKTGGKKGGNTWTSFLLASILANSGTAYNVDANLSCQPCQNSCFSFDTLQTSNLPFAMHPNFDAQYAVAAVGAQPNLSLLSTDYCSAELSHLSLNECFVADAPCYSDCSHNLFSCETTDVFHDCPEADEFVFECNEPGTAAKHLFSSATGSVRAESFSCVPFVLVFARA